MGKKPKLPYTIRLILRPSMEKPELAKVQVRLRLSDGRAITFTSKGHVDYMTAKHFFDSTGRPWNPLDFDKTIYLRMWGMYQAMQDAMLDIVSVDCTPIEEITRDMIEKDFTANLAIWSANNGGLEI